MNNINPTNTFYWKKLIEHFKEMKNISIKDLFNKDKHRFNNFSINFKNFMLIDFSKNLINKNTLNLLINLAKECKIKNAINNLFNGKILNKTEKTYVLYPMLRSNYKDISYKNNKIKQNITNILNKIKNFCENLNNNKWLGYLNEPITDIVNIGIGGSYIGPKMVINALKKYANKKLSIHFVSNIDGNNLSNLLNKINHSTTLFLISSKSFKTNETIINSTNAKIWFLKKAKSIEHLNKHFIIISSDINSYKSFEISKNNLFEMFNWVNGRFSIWSSIGLTISIMIGFKNFKKLLNGAYIMDNHFKNSKLEKNIPVILALIGIWYNNFFNFETECIVPYHDNLSDMVEYYQQLSMESNGKIIDRNNNKIKYQTGQISWGGRGTNSQHSFFQLMHQGTKVIPCDFILLNNENSNYNLFKDNNDILVSNCLAQSISLAFGDNYLDKKNSNKHCICYGNKPNNMFLLKELNPFILGSLISMYEHKIFIQGIILNIYSFDQWGVELGKKLFNKIYYDIKNNNKNTYYDNSTKNIINLYKKWKNRN